MSLKSAHAAIAAVNASPEKSFAAMMVASAAEAAREGDRDAFRWLSSPCSLWWLVAVVPSNDDCERVRAALLATIPAPADCLGAETFQPSETVMFQQLFLHGLELR